MFKDLWPDLRYGARMLGKSPGFTLVAVLTLALGIGVNAGVFSVINALLLRPLPVKDADQLTVLGVTHEGNEDAHPISYLDYQDYRKGSDAFTDLIAYQFGFVGLSADGPAERMTIVYVTPTYFQMLGVEAARGRVLLSTEGHTPGADPVLVLGHSYWRKRFGGDPGVVGKSVVVNSKPATIVGVVPEWFHGTYALAEIEGYMPISMYGLDPETKAGLERRDEHQFRVLGRLKPGVSLKQAHASLEVIAKQLEAQYPETNKTVRIHLFPEYLARPDAKATSPSDGGAARPFRLQLDWAEAPRRCAWAGMGKGGAMLPRILSSALVLLSSCLLLIAPGAAVPQDDEVTFYQEFSWSPDGKRIAASGMLVSRARWQKEGFGALKDTQYDVYVMKASGSGRRRLTDNPKYDLWTAWSPDGKRIVFGSDRDGNTDLYVMDASGANLKRLTTDPGSDSGPSWSPDGKRIAFMRRQDRLSQIWVMNADGSKQRRLAEESGWNPVWSPDGTKLLFFSNREGRGKDAVYVMAADGSGQTRLGPGVFPGWSPDGKRIIYTQGEDVYIMYADGSNPARLLEKAGFARWSPNGKKIAYVAGDLPETQIFVMNADGSRRRQITR